MPKFALLFTALVALAGAARADDDLPSACDADAAQMLMVTLNASNSYKAQGLSLVSADKITTVSRTDRQLMCRATFETEDGEEIVARFSFKKTATGVVDALLPDKGAGH